MKQQLKPYKFTPFLKSTLWGGNRICEFKGIENTQNDIGESWEICTIGEYDSIVSQGGVEDGSDIGLSLSNLIKKYNTRLLGKHVCAVTGNKFPLIAKFIDSKKILSIQVHPDDNLAIKRHNCLGKDEMWYVIDAMPGAQIYCGFNKKITPEGLLHLTNESSRANGMYTLLDIMASYPSSAGEVFNLPSGVIHTLGQGNLVAEIQQASDITYRIFDFNRKDKYGQMRQLHVEDALEAINYNTDTTCHICYDKNKAISPLVNGKAFCSYRIEVKQKETINLNCDSFILAICLEGISSINKMKVKQGETVLIPAEANVMEVEGRALFLMVHV